MSNRRRRAVLAGAARPDGRRREVVTREAIRDDKGLATRRARYNKHLVGLNKIHVLGVIHMRSSSASPALAIAAIAAAALAATGAVSAVGSAASDTTPPIDGVVPPGTYRIGYQGRRPARRRSPACHCEGCASPSPRSTSPSSSVPEWCSVRRGGRRGRPGAGDRQLGFPRCSHVSAVICCALSSQAGALKPKIMAGDVPAVISSAILPGLPERLNLFRPVLLLATRRTTS